MTQLEYYTQLLRTIALFGAWGLGAIGLLAFGVTTYYLGPWVKK